MNDNNSPFYTPLNIIIKADQEDPYTIFIEASTEDIDSQKDILFMKALEKEANNFLTKGLLSWDHLHKVKGDPEYIVGEPLDIKFDKSSKKTYVKGKLYRYVEYAKKIADLLKSGCTRLGASVGGFIKSRKSLTKAISGIFKVIWDELAITYKPINEDTMGNVSLIPIGAFTKALAVGNGVDASQFVGGRALINESMQGSVVKGEWLNSVVGELTWRIKSGDIRTPDDLKDFLSYYDALFLYNRLTNLLVKKFNNNGG